MGLLLDYLKTAGIEQSPLGRWRQRVSLVTDSLLASVGVVSLAVGAVVDQAVPNAAALRVLPRQSQRAILAGYYDADDGGGGVFTWSDVPATDDGGLIFNVDGMGTSSAGWRRIFSGSIFLPWFGAMGGGVADETSAVVRALAAAAGGVLYAPRGSYLLSASVTVPNSTIIEGDGKTQTIFKVTHTGDGLFINNPINASTASRVTLRRLSVQGDGVIATRNASLNAVNTAIGSNGFLKLYEGATLLAELALSAAAFATAANGRMVAGAISNDASANASGTVDNFTLTDAGGAVKYASGVANRDGYNAKIVLGAATTTSGNPVSCSSLVLSAPGGAGIRDRGGTYTRIEDCSVFLMRHGIVFEQSELSRIENCDLAANTDNGIWLVNSDALTVDATPQYTNEITISRCQLNANGFWGIADDGGVSHKFRDNNYNFNGLGDVYGAGAVPLTITDSEMEASPVGVNLSVYPHYSGSMPPSPSVSSCVGVMIAYNAMAPAGAGSHCVVFNYSQVAVNVTNNLLSSSGSSLSGVSNCASLHSWGNTPGSGGLYDGSEPSGGHYQSATGPEKFVGGLFLDDVRLRTGSGSPEGAVVGNIGDEYINKLGGASTTKYIKESGAGTNTGWKAVVTA